jgi:hypothetical protein
MERSTPLDGFCLAYERQGTQTPAPEDRIAVAEFAAAIGEPLEA